MATFRDDVARCTCPPESGEVLGTRLPCVVHPERERRAAEFLQSVQLMPRIDVECIGFAPVARRGS